MREGNKNTMIKSMGNLVAAVLLCALASVPSYAAYPDQPIKIIAPYAAGGSSDVLARALGEELSRELVNRSWSKTAPARAR